MSDIFYLRPIQPPIAPADVILTGEAGDCFKLHRVQWKHSFLSTEGGRMLCWYEAPDAESARIALRKLKASVEGVWAGNVIGDGVDGSPALSAANFVAELRLPGPPGAEGLDSLASTLRQEDVTLVRGFVSIREPKAVCVVRAASDVAVRSTLERAALSAEAVWPCTPINPTAGTPQA